MPTVINHIAVVFNLLQNLGMVFCYVHVAELEIVFMNSLDASVIPILRLETCHMSLLYGYKMFSSMLKRAEMFKHETHV